MSEPDRAPTRYQLLSLALIACIVGIAAISFVYTAGWLSPNRLTPAKLVAALAPPGGPAPGHRRNHAKGICFTGIFESNGAGVELSKAQAFASGQYPVLGRFNLGTPSPTAPDATVRVRGMGLQIATPNGEVWRMAMIDAPIFAVSTPEGFYQLLEASGSKDPDAMKNFVGQHPEFAAFADWAGKAPWTSSYAEDRFNSLNSFTFADAAGTDRIVRWSFVPAALVVAISPEDLAKRGADYLEQEIADRVHSGPQRWTMAVTIANPGDPTADPTKAWPSDRRNVEVGALIVQQIEAEQDGPCRDINFDPTVLPTGIRTSDDPFPAARSAAYSRSYNSRTAEAADYPHTASGVTQ